MNEGKITQVIGAVLDVQFSKENLPNLYNAIHIPKCCITSATINESP